MYLQFVVLAKQAKHVINKVDHDVKSRTFFFCIFFVAMPVQPLVAMATAPSSLQPLVLTYGLDQLLCIFCAPKVQARSQSSVLLALQAQPSFCIEDAQPSVIMCK